MFRRLFVKNCIVTLMIGFVLTLSARAQTPAQPQTPNPVGEWNLQTDAQGQITKFTLTITKTGETLKGKVNSEQYGTEDLKDLKFENGALTYTRNLELAGQAVAMAFKGKIEGEKLTGAYTVQGFELPVSGSRKPAAAEPPAKK